jgi:hypothetical protein
LRKNFVTIPIDPRVAMNANASGMPPKFAATPEKVVIIERIHRGVPSRMAAYAIKTPNTPPAIAVTPLSSMLFWKAPRYGWWKRPVMFEKVNPPCSPLNAPMSTWPAGRNRNAKA